MVKRLWCVCLSVLILVCTLTACGKGSDDASKQVDLTWVFFIGEQEDLKRANANVNELLADLLPNTTLTIKEDAGMDSKWSMWMSSKEEIDIAWTGYMLSMINEVNADSYLELDDLIKDYGPDIKKEAEEFAEDYATGVYNDATYAIPNLQPILMQTPYISIPAELYQYFPVDEFLAEATSNSKTTKKMYDLIDQYLSTVFSKGLTNTETITNTFDLYHMAESLVARGYDWIGSRMDGAYLCYDAFDDSGEIQSFFGTDAYKLYIDYAAKWYKAGFIPKDIMVSNSSSGSNKKAVFSLGANEMHYDEVSDNIKVIKDADGNITDYRLLLTPYDYIFNGTTLFGTYNTYTCLPYTCENPERAIKLLNLLKTDEGNELFNAIIYGIEGKHYTKDDSDPNDIVANGEGYVIQPDAYDLYGIPHWQVGNVYKAYRTPNIVKGQKEYCLDYIKNIKPKCHNTKYKGMSFYFDENASKVKNLQEVATEFNKTLLYGVKGDEYKDYYAKFVKELNANGIDDIIKVANEKAESQK